MLIKINGRDKFFARIESVTKTKPGHYSVIGPCGEWHVEGGRPAGGSSRDWFVDPPKCSSFDGKAMNATSLMDALRLIENC